MGELTISKPGPLVVELVLAKTTVPQQVLPREEHGKCLILPTYARLSVSADALSIKATLREPEDEWLTSNDPELPTIEITLLKQHILHLRTGDTWRPGGYTDYLGRHPIEYPAAVLAIRDPLGVENELYFTFASTDANNPDYWIKVLVKLICGELGVSEIPF